MNVHRFLRQQRVVHQLLPHAPTYSAQRMAQAVHVSGDWVAKTVLLKADGRYVLAVLPATYNLFLDLAQEALGVRALCLASEEECHGIFPDCELGALPPFGSLYGLPTVVDASLTEDEQIVFEGNTHHEAIRMRYQDFEQLERPRGVVTIACHCVG